MSKKIIIAGGGTGGHIFPAVAIAHAIKKLAPATEILFVGANGKMEMEKVPQEGFTIKGINIAGFNRTNMLKNVGLPFKLASSFFAVRNIIKRFKPDAVLGVGGYSTFPVLKTAQGKGIPTFIHESNAFAGKANKMLGKRATKVFVAAHNMEQFFPKEKIMFTGNPVRKNITNNSISKQQALQFFNLQEGKKTILAVGGSLGAKSINESIVKDLALISNAGVQIIWQTGKSFDNAIAQKAAMQKNVWVGAFIKEMEYAYAAADVVISRAGAMAIAELCLLGKPAVLVPYPFAAEDHQTHNAEQLVKAEAAFMVKDSEAPNTLVPTTLALIGNEAQQQQFSKNINTFAIPGADEVVAKEILKTIGSIT
jgi:UDP-N-acetylglucosamine--N-acetylmuramyl-(pentapeptide) pyrophosphoryl-undecaprenol N-acetylglucosamine transferase